MNTTLTVDSIVAATKLSRRPLEIAFRREINRAINDEIIRVRPDRVKDFLNHRDLSVNDVVAVTGFTRANHLFRAFRKHFGMSPRTCQLRQKSE